MVIQNCEFNLSDWVLKNFTLTFFSSPIYTLLFHKNIYFLKDTHPERYRDCRNQIEAYAHVRYAYKQLFKILVVGEVLNS